MTMSYNNNLFIFLAEIHTKESSLHYVALKSAKERDEWIKSIQVAANVVSMSVANKFDISVILMYEHRVILRDMWIKLQIQSQMFSQQVEG